MRSLLVALLLLASAPAFAQSIDILIPPDTSTGGGGGGGAPSGAAGGSLAGTYPNPGIAAGVITATEVATANKDGLAGVASMRTLGNGAQQAAAGNDSRLSDSRAPSGSASGDLGGSFPSPTVGALSFTGQRLTLGSTTDGQMLIRSGTTVTSQAFTTGDVVGPASAVTLSVPTFSGTTGKLIAAGSGLTVPTSGTLSLGILNATGLITGVGVTTTGTITSSAVATDITTGTNEDLTLSPNGTGVVVLTKGLTVSGVTNDITTGTNEDLKLQPNGTGQVILGGAGTIQVLNSSGTQVGSLLTGGSSNRFGVFNASATYGVSLATMGAIGATADAGATTQAACLSDNVTVSGSTCQISAYGSGKLVYSNPQSATCTNNAVGSSAGTLTLDPTSSLVYVTNSDPDGCVVTLSETSAVAGSQVDIVIVSNTGGLVTFPTSAGVHVSNQTTCVSTGIGVASVYTVLYPATLLEYVGKSCASN